MEEVQPLTLDEVRIVVTLMAKRLYEEYDAPIPDFDSRPPGKLESCLAQPFHSFDGVEAYPGLINKAAVLFFVLVKGHPLENGNKRMAVASLLLFLSKNGYTLRAEVGDFLTLAVLVAESTNMPVSMTHITRFIELRIIEGDQQTAA
ncbi:type II toxin-antitoxin system death-on-curing family toxin [Streptomyces sp. NPDC088196]|uniref:type II toxin-antitoxin system death-on-curing family toxin n=1 Tax=Streptomyces sp. NPDC088196 TaxID=3154868 RepID=UPI00344E0C0B